MKPRSHSYIILFLFFLALLYLLIPKLSFGQPSVIEAIQNALPAIVSVSAEDIKVVRSPHTGAAIDQSTGKIFLANDIVAAHRRRLGAGIIIDPAGFIATNYHIIGNANTITVTLSDGTTAKANVVSIFPQNDLALLHINLSRDLPHVKFANTNELTLGDEVLNVGHSQLLSHTISEGRITGLSSSLAPENNKSDYNFLRINMNLYKGDSGGPLLNQHGQLVGLIMGGQQRKDRSSFAIPSNKIKTLYVEYCKVVKRTAKNEEN